MERESQLSLKLDRLQMLRHAARRAKMQQIGLWRGQMPVLDFVCLHPGCTQASLANELGLSAATVAVSTKRLAKGGFLQKQADGENLRCNKLFLTPLGEKTLKQARAFLQEENERFFSALGEEEREELSRLLDRLMTPFGAPTVNLEPLENFILKNKLEQKEEEV
ncbi:MAG: winged helix-turn-helix transcriptional regulator [Clostridia bacterium]|nr:winged helix-turn-helix transcriptional regulator [Clostridia bacterium]